MKTRETKIRNITILGSIVNILLTFIKIIAGVIGCSAAMVADGVHSLSDLLSDIVVLIFSHISSKEKDKGHAFGHGKFETLATLIVSLILIIVGGSLMANGILKIIDIANGKIIQSPQLIALWTAIISIIAKEILYQATNKVGRNVNSPIVLANAWHHRSDAFSSIGALIGIGGAILLGNKWIILDPIVSCAISIFIIVIAVKMSIPCLAELLDSSLPEDIEKEIIKTALSITGVEDIHELKTRRNGISYIIYAHIVVDANLTVTQAHNISTNIEKALINKYGAETQANFHIEPGRYAE